MKGLPKLYMVREEGSRKEYLSRYNDASEYTSVRDATPEDLTSERLADLMDSDAEGRNSHAFVGVHSGLRDLIHKGWGEDTAARMMGQILVKGGLYSMGVDPAG